MKERSPHLPGNSKLDFDDLVMECGDAGTSAPDSFVTLPTNRGATRQVRH